MDAVSMETDELEFTHGGGGVKEGAPWLCVCVCAL